MGFGGGFGGGLGGVVKKGLGAVGTNPILPLSGLSMGGLEDLYKGLKKGFDRETGAQGFKDAAQAARELGEKNAEFTEQETAEQVRRKEGAARYKEGMAQAQAAASGIKTSGSTDLYLSEMMAEHKREVDWVKKSGKSRAGIERSKGDLAHKQGMAQAQAQQFSAGTQIAGMFL